MYWLIQSQIFCNSVTGFRRGALFVKGTRESGSGWAEDRLRGVPVLNTRKSTLLDHKMEANSLRPRRNMTSLYPDGSYLKSTFNLLTIFTTYPLRCVTCATTHPCNRRKEQATLSEYVKLEWMFCWTEGNFFHLGFERTVSCCAENRTDKVNNRRTYKEYPLLSIQRIARKHFYYYSRLKL